MIRTNRKTECPILDRLEKRYSRPHWVFLRELRNDTGFQSSRAADALAVGIYHSRGQLIIGFEKKVSRADWLRELKEPEKAEAIAQFCDQWYVVIPDASIVKLEELPPTWGLLHVHGNTISTLKQAPTLTPRPIDRGMLAAIVERTIEESIKPYLETKEEKRRKELDEEFERGRKCAAREWEHVANLKKQVEDFEKASGIRISEYHGGKEIGGIVGAIYKHERYVSEARRLISSVLYELENRTIPNFNSTLSVLNSTDQEQVTGVSGRDSVESISSDAL